MERNILRKQRTSAFPTVQAGLTRKSTLMEPTLAMSQPSRRSNLEMQEDNHSSRLTRLYS